MNSYSETASAYYELTKPKVVMLIVFTSLVGMFLAVPGMVPLDILIYGNLGIGLAASGAAVFNHLADEAIDTKMARTNKRPIPSGKINKPAAFVFALLLSSLSMLILVSKVNQLTAIFTLLSIIGYAVIYTLYLKRATPQNIVIGGAAGAAPPVLGWMAVTGSLDPEPLLLFLIVFIWTPPHFWALAIKRRDDYAAAGLPMLPVTHGIHFTHKQILYYTVLLLIVALLPFLTKMSGLIYLFGSSVFGFMFLRYVLRLSKDVKDETAMQTFGFSITYLMAIFTFLLVDHYFYIAL
ncbi:MAG: protoheme IX farnesyltransferase [Gammaproteobacteria bacterium]|nr:protoheme IX farnesyltransferase [Gammaproteobacteria bacterium]